MSPGSKPRRIEPEFCSKVWGAPHLDPWFGPHGDDRIGEVCFPANDLLIKFIFTLENLSVQVHPDDDYARRHENSLGKTEMWHILRADPGARIALGFKRKISPDRLPPAAQTGRIMELLNWIEVHPGDSYFVPAGTVHAIGGGIALCEIQENSDVTYRLFDYGRDRALHLQRGLEVAHTSTHPGKSRPRDLGDGVQLLVECPWFRTYSAQIDRPKFLGSPSTATSATRFLVALQGAGRVNGLEAIPGQVFERAGSQEWFVEPEIPMPSGSMEFLLIA